MVEPYEDEHTIDGEAAPVVQRDGRGGLIMLLVGAVIIAVAAFGYVNRDAIGAPNVMAYTESKDPYFVEDRTEAGGHLDDGIKRQRVLLFVRQAMSCTDVEEVELTPLGRVGGVWSARCVGG